MGAILFGILFFGLNPKDLFLPNHADRLTVPPGIQFNEYALAHTDGLPPLIEKKLSEKNGFTIEIALKSQSFQQEGFKFILSLHAGKDREQLLVAQWRSSIILMNGDDYDHKRRIKRLAVKTSLRQPVTQLMTIATGKEGTRVYFDGRLVGKKKSLILKIPKGGEGSTRLLLGNSVYGRHSWRGDIYGLALYEHALSTKDVKKHYKAWTQHSHFSFARKFDPAMLYYFDEKAGRQVKDHGIGACHFTLPQRLRVLQPEYFFQRFNEPSYSESFLKDTTLNFFGFLPFGFILAAIFTRLGEPFGDQSVLFTLFTGFFISLSIETIQAWTPSRNSDLLDIILNTLGAMVGATIFRYLVNAWARKA